MLSTYFWIILKVNLAGFLTARQSATVLRESTSTIFPAFQEKQRTDAPSDSTPTILMCGSNDFAATEIPDMSPPRPIGTIIVLGLEYLGATPNQ